MDWQWSSILADYRPNDPLVTKHCLGLYSLFIFEQYLSKTVCDGLDCSVLFPSKGFSSGNHHVQNTAAPTAKKSHQETSSASRRDHTKQRLANVPVWSQVAKQKNTTIFKNFHDSQYLTGYQCTIFRCPSIPWFQVVSKSVTVSERYTFFRIFRNCIYYW